MRVLRLLLLLSALPLFAADDYRIAIQVDPPQPLGAITIRGGDEVRSVMVENNTITVPNDLPLPWRLGLTRFESNPYTPADLQQRRPWSIRELGILHGTLQRSRATKGERFVWMMAAEGSDGVDELEFQPSDDGTFDVRLRAGLYQGAVLGPTSASRIRSGIVIKPGAVTNAGAILCEDTVPVSLRVIDAKRNVPVAGARILWDPPGGILNTDLSRALYARRWSTTTDHRGVATFASVGPLPLTVRWSIDAKSYASAKTTQLQLTEPRRFAMPDIRLRPEAAVTVRVQLPRDADAFEDAKLILGELDGEYLLTFRKVLETGLREGETRFQIRDYGRKRVWIENDKGQKLCYRDFDVVSENVLIDWDIEPVAIHGRVMQRDQPLKGVLVNLSDPHDSTVKLAQVRTDDDGAYRLNTYQTGQLRLYTIAGGGPGKEIGPATKNVAVTGKSDVQVDFEIADGGVVLVVVDAETGAPVKATIEKEFEFRDHSVRMGWAYTDEKGRMVFSGLTDGTAKIHIQAKGYRTADFDLPIREDAPEQVVKLTRTPPLIGRVVDTRGIPVRNARIMGAFKNELALNALLSAMTDADGRFQLDMSPEPGSMFYVVAPRYALGLTKLQPDIFNTVVLSPPVPGVVTLREDDKIPEKVYMIMALPVGAENFIPLGVLDQLAESNGMDPYQLQGTSLDGAVALPQFLGPGAYELFIAHQGGNPFIYQRIGAVNTPLGRNTVLAYKSQ